MGRRAGLVCLDPRVFEPRTRQSGQHSPLPIYTQRNTTKTLRRNKEPHSNRELEGKVNDSVLRRRKRCGHQKCVSYISCLTQKEFPDGQLIQKGIHFGLRRKLPTICQIYVWSHCSNIKFQGLDNSLAHRTRHLWNAGIVLVIVSRVVIEVRWRICDSSTGCVTCYS